MCVRVRVRVCVCVLACGRICFLRTNARVCVYNKHALHTHTRTHARTHIHMHIGICGFLAWLLTIFVAPN